MRRGLILFGLCVALTLPFLVAARSAEALAPCDPASFTVTGGTIAVAETIPAGNYTPPGSGLLTGLPAFCRVAGVLTPTSQSAIGFEVWMPLTTWNGKFRGEGSGGSAGSFSYSAMATALRLGFTSMSTDNGHKGSAWTFALQPEKVNDFGYRAFHLSTVAAKAILTQFYGSGPQYSYYVGCSQGGHHALMEAQRFPEDFDGIVAGDPANDWTHLMAAELWTGVVSSVKGPAYDLPQAKLDMLTNAVLQACGTATDRTLGFLVNPLSCHFDPSTLLCPAGDAPDCLTAEQLEAAQAVYQGPVNPRTGAQIYPGFAYGSENAWRQVLIGKASGGVPAPGGSSLDFFRTGVFNDPGYDFLSFDFDSDMLFTDTKPAGSGLTWEQALDANDPDLEVFKRLGGKLILYHGFADPFITPLSVIDYYGKVTGAMHPGLHKGNDGQNAAGLNKTKDFARLFMVPGMWHCSGGPGPTSFDVFGPLQQWVEQGIAPERITASHVQSGSVTFTRPLCPYPQQAAYSGEGDTNDAASFVCRVVKGK